MTVAIISFVALGLILNWVGHLEIRYKMYRALLDVEVQRGEETEMARLIDVWPAEKDQDGFGFSKIRKGEVRAMIVGEYGMLVDPTVGSTFGRGYYFCSTYEIFDDAETYAEQMLQKVVKKISPESKWFKDYPNAYIVHWEIHVTTEKLLELVKKGLLWQKKRVDNIVTLQPAQFYKL